MNYLGPKASEDEDQLQQMILPPRKPYHHFESTITSNQIHFYLSKEIAEPYEYVDMMHRITTASPYDVIFIHLNTVGGRLDTGIQLINAMKNSQAKIITCLECNAYSLGTLIFLSGDEMIVNDHCMLMFHDYSGGTGGKGNEQVSQLTATHKWFTTLFKKVYTPFLTESEVERILKGEDLWMASTEVKSRLNKMIKQMSEDLERPKKPRKSKKELPAPPPEPA
jgi:ATP-dependent protease ClpP protease subunit